MNQQRPSAESSDSTPTAPTPSNGEQPRRPRRGVSRRTLLIGGGVAVAGVAGAAYVGSRGPSISFPSLTMGATGPRVLVAYDSQYGSTGESAAAVGTHLSASARVDVRHLSTVQDLTGYQALILGAPVQKNVMKESATTWLRNHASELSTLPHAWFMPSASFGIDPDRAGQEAAKLGLMEDAAALTGTNPVSMLPTGGLVDFSRMSLMHGWVYQATAGNSIQGDFRDPRALTAWVDEVAPALLG